MQKERPAMPRFFEDSFSPEQPVLRGAHVRHIGFSLRMRPGEQLTVCSCGTDYACEIEEIT
jgi:16S rRNA (uracil1498-N3)-methyltransferase